jgi:DNA polymerase-3 subunit beta
MRLTVDRGPLLEALGRAIGAAGNGKTIPILSHVLLEAEGEVLRLGCTDLTVDIVCECPATVEEAGRVAVPAGLLHDMVKNLPEGAELALRPAADVGRVVLQWGRSKFHLPTLPPGDFPVRPGPTVSAKVGTVEASALLRLLDKTAFAMAAEDGEGKRYWLQGVSLKRRELPGGPVLRAEATDAQVLARVEMPCPEGLADLSPVILPARLVHEIRRLLGGVGGEADLVLDGDRIMVEIRGARLGSQRINYDYPDLDRVIPADVPHVVKMGAGALRSAVRRALLVAMPSGSGNIRAVSLQLAEREARFAAWSLERGAADDVVEVDYAGPEIELRFNGRQFAALVDQLDGERVELSIKGPGDPVLIRDPADPARLAVNVPLKV